MIIIIIIIIISRSLCNFTPYSRRKYNHAPGRHDDADDGDVHWGCGIVFVSGNAHHVCGADAPLLAGQRQVGGVTVLI